MDQTKITELDHKTEVHYVTSITYWSEYRQLPHTFRKQR